MIVPTTRLTLRIGNSAIDLFAPLNRRLADLEQPGDVEGLLEAMVLRDLTVTADLGADVGLVEDVGEIESLRLPVVDGLPRLEAVHATHHFVDRAEAKLRHDLPHFLRR